MKSFFTTVLQIILFLTLTYTVSFSQVNWTKYPNPVLSPGDQGEWDDLNVGITSVLSLNDTLHMWYDANYYDENGDGPNGIGHAISTDGISWTKDPLNPVLTPGPSDWEACNVEQATVLYNTSESLFHMWYSGRGDCNIYQPLYIGHATSSNGNIWTKDSDWVLGPGTYGSWDDDALMGPEIINVNDTLHMWYNGFKLGATGNSVKIGHAISTNWTTWEKDPANPVLRPGSVNDWDYPRIRAPRVIHVNNTYHMFYIAGYHPDYDIGYAQSTDGSKWIKYNDSITKTNPYMNSDPVIKRGSPGTWDDDMLWTGSVLFNNNNDSLRMWFTGATNNASYSQIGYATSFFDSSIIDGIDISEQGFPNDYKLKQNYPNPFNPTTMINYQLPVTSYVTITIYNLLGQKVATLVNKRQQAGFYQVEWDANGFASGLYYYRIDAGNFVGIRKMIYLK
jgi:predicted GH43/DUF377 family glycosyl hydrolase